MAASTPPLAAAPVVGAGLAESEVAASSSTSSPASASDAPQTTRRGLVRMSDFCSPLLSSSSSSTPDTSYRRRRRRVAAVKQRRHQEEGSEMDRTAHAGGGHTTTTEGSTDRSRRRVPCVPVSISIATSVPGTLRQQQKQQELAPPPPPSGRKHPRRQRQRRPNATHLNSRTTNDDANRNSGSTRTMQPGGTDHDPRCTVYSADPSLLVELGAFEGTTVCSLSSRSAAGDSDADDTGGRRRRRFLRSTPVVIRIVPGLDVGEQDGGGGDGDGGGDDNRKHRIYVPPCLAASAGLYDMAPSTLRCAYLRPVLSSIWNDVRLASRAVVGEIAPPPSSSGALGLSRFSRGGSGRGNDNAHGTNDKGPGQDDECERQVKSLQDYFVRTTTTDKKDAPRLMAVGTIFAVPDQRRPCTANDSYFCTTARHVDDVDGDDDSDIRFYEVISMEGAKDEEEDPAGDEEDEGGHLDGEFERNARRCYLVSPQTELVLQESRSGSVGQDLSAIRPPPCRRLPGLSQAISFSSSVATLERGGVERSGISDRPTTAAAAASSLEIAGTKGLPRRRQSHFLHPSIHAVTNALLVPWPSSSSSSSVGDYITQIVGSPDDHVQECVEAATDALGMRCIQIDGLAAFDYRYQNYKQQQQQRRQQQSSPAPTIATPVTGSLAEKLSGLGSALTEAARSAPCVLHICNVDRELSSPDVDADARTDEESRFVAILTEALLLLVVGMTPTLGHTERRQRGGEGGYHHPNYCSFAPPPLLVVLSSSKPMPAGGPLSSLPNREVVHVSHPDGAYARQLWEGPDGFDGDGNGDAGLPPFDDVRVQLLGRTANEIEFVRHRLLFVMRNDQGRGATCTFADEFATDAAVTSILKELDDGPCVVSGSSASKLSSSLIPNVRWEDVGGLSHVRDEVMDAIELPLRHPDLFSGGGGRSGILLFGAPGTGKTLVAKALATECGLPFLSVKGPELLGSYVGESEANVRAAFASAREAAASTAGRDGGGGAILFFDELDSLAPRRGGVGDGGGVMERVVATLLGELDGDVPNGRDAGGAPLAKAARVFVVGATNRPDLLDPSLLRPGRFDRLVYLGLAQTREDRIKILAAQVRKFRFEHGQDAISVIGQVIDSIPTSLSGADLSAIAKGALMRSLKRLCEEAEEEVSLLNEANKRDGNDGPSAVVDVNDVVATWDEDRLVPVVRAEDFIVAARDVTPSVSEKELVNYESLKAHFCA